MFALVFVALAVAVVARLAIVVVRHDRPMTPPRSHFHELDRRIEQFRFI